MFHNLPHLNFEYFEFVKADGFDDAIIGIDCENFRYIYSYNKALEILEEHIETTEAIDFLEFEIKQAYFGNSTPIFI